jgi:hypothetical protein
MLVDLQMTVAEHAMGCFTHRIAGARAAAPAEPARVIA